MQETITPEAYKKFLELAPANILKQAGEGMASALENIPEDSQEFEMLGVMLTMLIYELQIREVEPLWRKAKRLTIRSSTTIIEFTTRNSDTIKEVGKIAACIAAGVLLGKSLDK